MKIKPEDELVTKQEARSVVVDVFENYTEKGINWPVGMCIDCSEAIDKLPAVQIKSPEQIETVIKKFQQWADSYFYQAEKAKELADLLRWVLNQKQDMWTDKELLG